MHPWRFCHLKVGIVIEEFWLRMEQKRKDCLFWKVIYCLFNTHDVAKIIMDKNSYCIYTAVLNWAWLVIRQDLGSWTRLSTSNILTSWNCVEERASNVNRRLWTVTKIWRKSYLPHWSIWMNCILNKCTCFILSLQTY